MVQEAYFNFVELTLTAGVSVTLPNLLWGILSLCSKLPELETFVVRLPQDRTGSRYQGLGTQMMNLLEHFKKNKKWNFAKVTSKKN